MTASSFSQKTQYELQFYVYRLLDPRNGLTFYVGKGKGNRMFNHANLSVEDMNAEQEEQDLKLSLIRDIKSQQLEPLIIVHRHGMTEEQAFEVEAALIDCYGGLTNIQGGVGSNDRGPATHEMLEKKYALPLLHESEIANLKICFINVNSYGQDATKNSLYDQTRFSWRLNPQRARKADFVVAVKQGVTLAVMEADEWLEANPKNFPTLSNGPDLRWAFNGRQLQTTEPIHIKIVGSHGKLLPKCARHVQNPIKYWNL